MAEVVTSLQAPAITVLMLEDSLFDRDLNLAHLDRAGYTVGLHHATGREDFVRLLGERDYDLILADYDVPGFNGMLALDMVRERDSQVPFIFISGVVGEEVAIDSLHRGATDYVLKQRLGRLGPAVRRALKETLEHKIRLQAEATARASEERFRQLTNALPQLVWTLDDEGSVTYANPAWHKFIHQDSLRWCDERVLHPDDLPACEAAWHAARQTREGFSLEVRMHHHAVAEYCWYIVRVVPFGAEGDVARWLCTATDVQEQRVKEEALRTAEKLAVTGRMAATIAHEINNPLESLTNLVFLLKQDAELSPGSRHFINMADYELQRVSAIAKQTLAFYRDNSTPAAFAVEDLLQDVLRLFDSRFRNRNIKTELHVTEDSIVFATRGDLRQVMINLISNAIDAVPQGGKIRVMAAAIPETHPPFTRITVEDSGTGISAENADRLFKPFFSTKGEHGTGLGLWVSKGIIEKHGGSIAIASHAQPDGSNRTRVEITLPRDPAEQAAGDEESPAA